MQDALAIAATMQLPRKQRQHDSVSIQRFDVLFAKRTSVRLCDRHSDVPTRFDYCVWGLQYFSGDVTRFDLL